MVWSLPFKERREQVEKFVYKYAHFAPTIALLWGLFWDTLTLRRPDNPFENAVVIAYLLLTAGVIIILNLRRSRGGGDPSLLLLGFLQFGFGNLTSALIILYAKSGTFVGSVIFFAILGSLLVGNEFIRNRYSRTYLHIAVWYVLLLSYLVVVVPIFFGAIGDFVFLVSVLLSLSVVTLLIAALYAVSAKELTERIRQIISTIGVIAIVWSGLYFFGFIPPAPLMLKHIGVYHSISRTPESDYKGMMEPPFWYELFADTSRLYTYEKGKSAYCASAVFAPARLEAPVFHRWEHYDELDDDWIAGGRIPFSIRGGRDGGFRGYTVSPVRPGTWRCSVETERGALIGRITFKVVERTSAPTTQEVIF